MIIESFPVGPLGCNTTLMGDPESHDAIVVDPGDEIPRIYERLTAQGLTLRQILITHAHLDHVGGALQLKEMTGAPIYMNENDLPLLQMVEQQAKWMGIAPPAVALPDKKLNEGDTVGLPGFEATVLCTPGHTQGSVSLYFADLHLLVAGDTLFAGSVGRTDLPGGNYQQLLESIRTQLLPLPDETRVLTGHGPSTTIGAERRGNPFLHLR
jgi:hydroxyacylglutathione hydrolase